MPKAKRKTGRIPLTACCVYCKGWRFFPGSLLPSSLPTKPHGSPSPCRETVWMGGEVFPKSCFFSPSQCDGEGSDAISPARPQDPPTRDLEAESILPNSTHLKGNTGFIPKSKQGSFPSCKLSAGDAVSAWMELHALAAPGMWHCCHCCPHPSYLVWWLTTLPMAGG